MTSVSVWLWKTKPSRSSSRRSSHVVFDHPVVHDGHGGLSLPAAQVRVGVAIGRRPVGGPPRVADSTMTAERTQSEHLFQGPDTPGTFPHVELIRIEESQPGAVITAVLQPQQAGDQDRAGLMRPGVTDDSTHASSPSYAGTRRIADRHSAGACP